MKDLTKLIGCFLPTRALESIFDAGSKPDVREFYLKDASVTVLDRFLTDRECKALVAELDRNPQVPVGNDGYANHYVAGEPVCSLRSTLYSEAIAKAFFERLAHIMNPIKNPYNDSRQVWEARGVNPAMRLIDYPQSGYLVPHYDLPYQEAENCMSLCSLVIFLTTNQEQGATRFILENRVHDDSDWGRSAHEHEVAFSVAPLMGRAVLFPHNLLHEGQSTEKRKIILRTDIMFKESSRCIN